MSYEGSKRVYAFRSGVRNRRTQTRRCGRSALPVFRTRFHCKTSKGVMSLAASDWIVPDGHGRGCNRSLDRLQHKKKFYSMTAGRGQTHLGGLPGRRRLARVGGEKPRVSFPLPQGLSFRPEGGICSLRTAPGHHDGAAASRFLTGGSRFGMTREKSELVGMPRRLAAGSE